MFRTCERVAALCAAEGAKPALAYAGVWLRSRLMGFGRVAQQRDAVAAALRLPNEIPGWHPVVPIIVHEAFQAAYGAPLLEAVRI